MDPPHYSSQLDCFSHGVLTIQIVTRQFPKPGGAHQRIQDSKFPNRRLLCQVPETERRKKDIDLIEPNHTLLPIALSCLKDNDEERPSADEVCERLASLKREGRYVHSVEQAKDQASIAQQLQDQLAQLRKERDNCKHELEQLFCGGYSNVAVQKNPKEQADLQGTLQKLPLQKDKKCQAELEKVRAELEEFKAKDHQILDIHEHLKAKKVGRISSTKVRNNCVMVCNCVGFLFIAMYHTLEPVAAYNM